MLNYYMFQIKSISTYILITFFFFTVNYYYRGKTKKNGSDDSVAQNVCPQCGRNYRHKTTMLTHIKYECNKEPQFVCIFCGKRIYYPSNFKKHLILKHGYMIA